MKNKKIVITGGHLTPALAVIERLNKQKRWEIFYFGRKYHFEGKKTLSEESQIVPRMGAKFISLTTGRLQRKFTRYTIPSLLKIPFGFIQSFFCLLKIKPKMILSFGSYVSVPVVIAGWLLGIPVISHEQTVSSGLANLINTRFSRIISVSYPESLLNFPKKKTILTGNPVRLKIFKSLNSPFTREISFQITKTGLPLIYITGGNQGAAIINQTVRDILERLLKRYLVIHQTGSLDYLSSLNFVDRLPEILKERYFIKDFVGQEEIGWVFKNADLVVSRSGANICWELGALGKPAILIPIPFSSGGEQQKNALRLARLGSVKIVEQKELTPGKLLSLIEEIFNNLEKYQKAGEKAKKEYSRYGDQKLVKIIDEVLAEKKLPKI